MRKYIIFLLVLLFFKKPDLQAAIDSTITISGQFSGNSQKYGSKFSIFFYNNYYGLSSPFVRYDAVIKDNRFRITLKNRKPFAYIAMLYGIDENNNVVRTRSTELLRSFCYLVSAGSSVSLKISDNNVKFEGIGSGLLRCQYDLYQAAQITGRSYLKGKALTDSLFNNQVAIIDRYKPEIGEMAGNILKADFDADRNLRYINSLSNYSGDVRDKQANESRFRLYADHFLFMERDTTHLDAKLISRSYGEFLLRKMVHDLDISMITSSTSIKLNFDQIYESINHAFKGELRDKLLVGCFLDYYQRREAPAWYLDDALKRVKTKEYSDFIQEFKNTYVAGMPAFNFSLPDSSGKVYTLEMLKGKVVILDFWFTGCGGCKQLNEKMQPVYEYYNNNPDVLFVSVAIDKKPEMFKHSLKTGDYTHPGSLNLYTGGKGEDDPVIKYYKVIAYPTVIVIGKDGKIVSSSPPLPYTEESTERLKHLINTNLMIRN